MKKIVLLVALAAICSCADYKEAEPVVESAQRVKVEPRITDKEELLVSGEIRIRVDEEFSAKLEAATLEDGMVDLAKIDNLTGVLSRINIVGMRRLFPYAGEFEERTREDGLHLWYVVSYSGEIPATTASAALDPVKGIDLIEYVPKVEIVDNGPAVRVALPRNPKASVATDVFNDPYLPRQWHYYNDGSVSGGSAGCDVNCVSVWKKNKAGNANIVVAVVDQGVDYSHEDLTDNMWNNPKKTGGDLGGRCGHNFVSGSDKINPGDHGTHVAGNISAVNNNGKGVCGIAGGDSKKNVKGVKIMSCQIFDGSGSASGSEAIKWACDNGAVIAQNSWGYIKGAVSSVPASDKAAIDYFVKNAKSEDGTIVGGLVTFSAGNDDMEHGYPAEYEGCIAVASVGADYRRAYYSNYGSWVDVCAPGGDASKGNQILSTLPGNSYGYMQGTSMACPHVSGVLALMMANAGKGTKAETLRTRLESRVTDVSAYNNKDRKIGSGLVNAALAVSGASGGRPEKPTNFKAALDHSNYVDFSVTVPSDPDDGKPTSIYIYYSTKEFSSLDGIDSKSVEVGDKRVGDKLEGTVALNGFDQTFYLAAVACDLSGLKSPKSEYQIVTTESNSAPVITPLDGTSVKMKSHEKKTLRFNALDREGHMMTDSLRTRKPELAISSMRQDWNAKGEMEGSFTLAIDALKTEPGTYDAWVLVGDEFLYQDSVCVTYEIEQNHAPVVKTPIPNKVFNSKNEDAWKIKGSDFFEDPDGEILSYTFEVSEPAVVNATSSADDIYFTPMSYGIVDVKITGTDARGLSCSQNFKIMVRDGSVPFDYYPNPVRDKLNIRSGSEAPAAIKVISGLGAVVYDETTPMDPFNPLQIDFTGKPAGEYRLEVGIGGQTTTKTIVKL